MTRPVPVYVVAAPARPSLRRLLLTLVVKLAAFLTLCGLFVAAVAHEAWGWAFLLGLPLAAILRNA